jgi:hypothetical protein
MHHYSIAGLSVASELALPGALPAASCEMPDVVMRQGHVPEKLDGVVAAVPAWETNGSQIILRAPGAGRFLVSDGSKVTFEPAAGADAADCAIYLLGSVFGFLLHQRGRTVLHASAVAVDGKAVLFCGPSGIGKSTLAAALCSRGYPLISDDVCAISFDAAGTPFLNADARQLKLTPEAIQALGLAGQRGAAVQRHVQKFYVEPSASASVTELPVSGVYMLRWQGPSWTAGIERPDMAKALRLVLRNAYRPGFVKRTGQSGHYLKAAAMIAERAGIFRLTRHRDLARLNETVTELERHWSQNGLLHAARRR